MTGCGQNNKHTLDTKQKTFYIYKYKYFYGFQCGKMWSHPKRWLKVSNIMSPFQSWALGLLSEPAKVHATNLRNHQSAESGGTGPCFFISRQCLRENKHRHKAVSVSRVCLDLGLCVCACVRVCVWVCGAVHICAANHIKGRESSSVVKTPDPGVLRNTGRAVEKQIKRQLHLSTNAWPRAHSSSLLHSSVTNKQTIT